MDSFVKPPPFIININRKMVLSSLADLERISDPEKNYLDLYLFEVSVRLGEEVPEMRKAIDEYFGIGEIQWRDENE